MNRLKTTLLLTVIFTTFIMSAENVLLKEFRTTNGLIPFDKIQKSDYEPAIRFAIDEHNAEIDKITSNPELPTFENTIVALDRSGRTLGRVLRIFDALNSADADDELLAISERITPICSEHSASLILNEKLWKRIKYVHDNCDISKLDTESKTLLKNTYNEFVTNGASLEGKDRDKYRELYAKLSAATLKFGQNALKATSAYEMWLTADQIKGLPESAIDAAKADARSAGNKGGEYLITLQYPSYSAFMKYSSDRDLRKELYLAYNSQCMSGEYDNTNIEAEIAELRYELAKLLGFSNYAEYNLQNTMAATPANVYKLLDQLRDSYQGAQKREIKELTDFASKIEGKKMTLMPWDYSFYFNKLKHQKYDFNDEVLRPYFELSNVINGVFGFATKMYGLHFTENFDAQVYHADVKVYTVTDDSGKYIGTLYTDFFPRSTKRSGAWMTEFGGQYIDENRKDVRPLITIVTNFTRPTETKPSLLTFYEVETFLHEFGHALHGLLTECKYASLSGTNVYHDFVELPSQFNENYLTQKEFLDSFAKHYQTGEKISQEIIDKIIASSQFGAAYACIRQLNFGYLDMAWHTTTAKVTDPVKFEEEAISKVQIFPTVKGTAISSKFTHIFSGGYAAGYYGYKWAEVLDADAFSKFLEDGIFNQTTAHSFRDNILKRGGSDNPMVLYKKFRGKEPSIEALLIRDGIKTIKKNTSKQK